MKTTQSQSASTFFVAPAQAPQQSMFGGANIAPAVIRHLAAQATSAASQAAPAQYVESTASFGGANIAPAVIRHLAATH